MKKDVYAAVIAETERLRQAFSKKDTENTSRLRLKLGALKPKSRRHAIKLVKKIEEFDLLLSSIKTEIISLQKSISLDLKRMDIIQSEEYAQALVRQKRLDEIKDIVEKKNYRVIEDDV